MKEILDRWLEQNEGAKFWRRVMNEPRNHGAEDVLLAVFNGLKGFPKRSWRCSRRRQPRPAGPHARDAAKGWPVAASRGRGVEGQAAVVEQGVGPRTISTIWRVEAEGADRIGAARAVVSFIGSIIPRAGGACDETCARVL